MRTLPLALLPLAFSASVLVADTVFSDSFDRVAVLGSDRAETAYSESNVYRILAGAGVFSGVSAPAGALGLSGAPYSAVYVRFPRVKLASAGDSVTVTFTVRYPFGAADSAYSLRVGLYLIQDDLPTAHGFDAEKNPRGDKAPGYYLATNPGLDAPESSVLSKDLANQKARLGSGAINSNVSGSSAFLAAGHGFRFGDSPRVFSLTVARGAHGVTVSGGPDGSRLSAEDHEFPWTEFDSIVISTGDGAGPFHIDDLVVSAGASR